MKESFFDRREKLKRKIFAEDQKGPLFQTAPQSQQTPLRITDTAIVKEDADFYYVILRMASAESQIKSAEGIGVPLGYYDISADDIAFGEALHDSGATENEIKIYKDETCWAFMQTYPSVGGHFPRQVRRELARAFIFLQIPSHPQTPKAARLDVEERFGH